MSVSININRLTISLQGISAHIVEEATKGLEQELVRRLGTKHVGMGLATASSMVDVGELQLTKVHGSSTINAAGLREMIAQQLILAIETEAQSHSEEMS